MTYLLPNSVMAFPVLYQCIILVERGDESNSRDSKVKLIQAPKGSSESSLRPGDERWCM